MKANIVGHIDNVKKPKDAQFCVLTKIGFIEMFYRIADIKMNDGTTEKHLQYYSSCGGGWMGSMQRDQDKFLSEPKFYTV